MKEFIKILLRESLYETERNVDFDNWFRGSKVVDSDGNPLIVYHGTSEENMNSIITGGFDLSKNRHKGAGIHFMTKEEYTKGYNTDGLIKAYVRLLNPMPFSINFKIREKIIMDLLGIPMDKMTSLQWGLYSSKIDTKFREVATRMGYDGVYQPNQVELIVFDPENVWVIK